MVTPPAQSQEATEEQVVVEIGITDGPRGHDGGEREERDAQDLHGPLVRRFEPGIDAVRSKM